MKPFMILTVLTATLLAGDTALAAPKPSTQSSTPSHHAVSTNNFNRTPVHTSTFNHPNVTTFKQITGSTFPLNYSNRGFNYNFGTNFYRPTHHDNYWSWYQNWHTNFGNYLPTWFFGGYWNSYYPSWYGSPTSFGYLYR